MLILDGDKIRTNNVGTKENPIINRSFDLQPGNKIGDFKCILFPEFTYHKKKTPVSLIWDGTYWGVLNFFDDPYDSRKSKEEKIVQNWVLQKLMK